MSRRNMAKMLMLSRSGYDDMESRFRDSRGRTHYDNGRYAPTSLYPDRMNYEVTEPMYGTYYDEPYHSMPSGRVKRYDIEYDDGLIETRPSSHYPMYGNYGSRPIGFRDRSEYRDDYRSDMTYPMRDEMSHTSSKKQSGYADSRMTKLDKQTAEEWANSMQNFDGTTGAHWDMNQTKQVMQQFNADCDPIEFYVVMNSLYSDYGKTLSKYGMNKVEVYADLAKDWLKDKDAVSNKAAAYFEHIVK